MKNSPVGWVLLSISSSSSSLNFSLERLKECEWLWPPLMTRTIFSMNRNTNMPVKIHKPTMISLSWLWVVSGEGGTMLQYWPWSWWSSPWLCLDKECGIKCKNASPNSPPDAKLKSIFKNGWCSSLLSMGMKNSTKNGSTLMATVDASALTHSIGSTTVAGRDLVCPWWWSWPWSWWWWWSWSW